jgi:hypothetical protein
MAGITVDGFTSELTRALGGRLQTLLLYGSMARGTHVPDRSDVNTLLVCDVVDETLFTALDPPLRAWTRAGHPAPLIFGEREWRESPRTFPIEYEEIREAHRVLAGRDPWLGDTQPSVARREDLRRQLAFELMGKVLRLRQAYVATRGDGKRLTAVVAGSASGIFTMLRGALRLGGRPVPNAPADVARAAAALIGFPGSALDDVAEHKHGRARLALSPRDPRAAEYLDVVTRTAEFVNRLTVKE